MAEGASTPVPGTSDQDPTEIFQLIERLGEGSYGEVFNALDTRHTPPKVVAIKLIPLDGESSEEFKKEIDILKECDSEYIVQYMGSYVKDNELWIAMEYCGAGSVSDLLSICHVTLTEPEIADVCASVLEGLVYLHRRHNIHRDVKAGNVLLCPEGQAKLADFGVSAQMSNTMSRRRTVIGTPFWMAPEVIQETSYDGKADIWSLGITVIEMAEGEPPNADIHPMRAIFVIPTKPSPTLREADKWSDEMHDFVSQCLQKEPADRPTAVELLGHPFVATAVEQLRSRKGVSPILSELVERHMPAICDYRENAFGGEDDDGYGDTVVKDGDGAAGGTVRRSGGGTTRRSRGTAGSGGVASNDSGTMVRHGGTVRGAGAGATGTVVMHGTTVIHRGSDSEGDYLGGMAAGDTGTVVIRRAPADTGTMVRHGGDAGSGGADHAATEPSFLRYFRDPEDDGGASDIPPGARSMPATVGTGGGSAASRELDEFARSIRPLPMEDLRGRLVELEAEWARQQELYEGKRAALRAALSALGEGDYV